MYKNLKEMPVYNEAVAVSTEIFRLTENLPKKEDYALTSQIRRASLSVFGNIAEAYGRGHNLDKINFYYFSRGSLTETLAYLEYGQKVGYFPKETVEKLSLKLLKMNGEINKIIVSLGNFNKDRVKS